MKANPTYLHHSIMTHPGTEAAMVQDIPNSIEAIVLLTQNICLHTHWVKAYGVSPSRAKIDASMTRSFERRLEILREAGVNHISEPLTNDQKMLGICRDFSVIACALCRQVKIPARARAGFADYLEKGKMIDHWVLEYWHAETGQWIMVDAQMDALQSKELELSFDPLHVSPPHFLTAAQSWLGCRNNTFNPEHFGIFNWWGYDYLRINLLLDANSLLDMPMHPWDFWKGYKSLPIEQWLEKDYDTMDHLARLILDCDQDYEALYNFVNHHDMIKVPQDLSTVYNGFFKE